MKSEWLEKSFRRLNPGYRDRWTVYDDLLRTNVTKETVWLDVGCGKNEHIATFGRMARSALGIDSIDAHERMNAPFIKADLRHMPLRSSSASLITLRLVVEHLERVPHDFSEVGRLLKPGGKMIILTTNTWSPVVFLPRLIPYPLKSRLIQKMFGVQSDDVFRTFHRFNTPRKMAKGLPGMKLESLQFLEGVPLGKGLLVIPFWVWYTIVKFGGMRCFRSNLLAVFSKT